jgi:hypothetical protein
MNLRKWLFKTKETLTTTNLSTADIFTIDNNSNNNKKPSEKQEE